MSVALETGKFILLVYGFILCLAFTSILAKVGILLLGKKYVESGCSVELGERKAAIIGYVLVFFLFEVPPKPEPIVNDSIRA